MIQIIENRDTWNQLVGTCSKADFYHTYDFHILDKKEGEKAILVHYTDSKLTVLLPLLLRPIKGTDFFDATSVYGYAGPLLIGEVERDSVQGFQSDLEKTMGELQVVSVFSRLHPYIPRQLELLDHFGEVDTLGMVVNIDVTQSPEDQWTQVSKRFRTYINKARRTYTLRNAKGAKDLETFIRLYEMTMHRLHAQPQYFFSRAYYEGLFYSREFETQILMAEDPESGTVVSAAMFVSCGQMVQYHLSGTHPEFTQLHPVKLLIDEMRLRATKAGKTYLNLGGGLGGAEDSLFEFKSRFSKDFRPFHIWKYVHNREVYNQLSEKNLPTNCKQDFRTCKHFFPCYRCSHHIT